MKAINIQWDVDDEKDLESLPTEIKIPAGMINPDEISDYLSDETGFCHTGFAIEGNIVIEANCKQTAIDQINTLINDAGTSMTRLITEVEIHGMSVEDVASVYDWMRHEIELQA